MRAKSFQVGKIPPETLVRTVFPHGGSSNRRLLLGPGIGRDVAAVKYDRIMIFTADPVTGTTRRIGEHSVYINANDIATAGAIPLWFMCTILLPPGTNEITLSTIMEGIDYSCRKLGITVVRGHTEATRGLDRPIISGFMIGEKKGRLLRAEDVRVGDAILMTRTAGIEGTAILASEFAHRLKRVSDRDLERARQFSNQINIVREALSISKLHGLRVMHDPTEGGVLNACWELGESSHLGVEVWADKVPVADETSKICSQLRLDPLKLMSSGCLLAVVAPGSVGKTVAVLRRLRVPVSVIGKMIRPSEGRRFSKNGKDYDLIAVPRDELYRLA